MTAENANPAPEIIWGVRASHGALRFGLASPMAGHLMDGPDFSGLSSATLTN
jgi:hypothetical protein